MKPMRQVEPLEESISPVEIINTVADEPTKSVNPKRITGALIALSMFGHWLSPIMACNTPLRSHSATARLF